MTGERDRYRSLTTAAVLLVAAIAAVVSYMHVVSLAIRFGQPPAAAYLLPVSVDGLVAVSSLVMLRSARLGVSAPWLARTGLVLAVGATLACNVAYGLPHGAPRALLSGSPAVAFVVSAEMAIGIAPATDADARQTAELVDRLDPLPDMDEMLDRYDTEQVVGLLDRLDPRYG